jgi:phytoene dehydrogenase-like protein
MHDVIVVGGGIGGIGVAALLAKQGRKVLLLEQHAKVGGKCASHEKDGFKVPDFLHAFARGSKGNCSLIARMVGEEIAWGRKVDGLPLYLNGQWIKLIIGEGLWDPPRLQGLKLPLKDGIAVAKLMVLDTLPKLFTKKGQDELDRTDLRSWLSKRTDNAVIHGLVAYCFPAYYGVPYWEASVGETLRILWDLWKSRVISYPMEGCGAIPEAFLKGFKKYGGEFEQGKVKRIVVSEGKVQGVELSDGKLLEAPLVISNAGIRKTVLGLVGEEHFDKGYVNYVRDLKPSCTALVIHIALSKKIIDVPGGVTVPSEDPVKYFRQLERGEIPEKPTIWAAIPSSITPEVAPQGKQLLVLGVPVPYRDDADYWKKWADKLFAAGEELFPGISEYIIWKEVATGDRVKKLDDLGVGFPVAQTNWQCGANRPSMISPINGLYYVGADVGKRAIGVDMAAESALRCAEIVANKLGPVG